MAWQRWVAEVVGEWLAATPDATPFPSNRVQAVLEECVGHLGGKAPLQHAAQLEWNTISVWRRGASIPTLGSLLRLCHHLGTPPRQLLTAGAAALAPDGSTLPGTPEATAARRPRGSFDVARAKRAIDAALAATEAAPTSVAAIARQLECAPWALRRHLPEECRALVGRRATHRNRAVREAHARRCNEVRRATIAVHEQGVYPSGRRVAVLLNNPRDLIRAEVRAVWQTTLRELGWQLRRRKGVYIP